MFPALTMSRHPVTALLQLLFLLPLICAYNVSLFGQDTLTDLLLHHGSGSDAALTVVSALAPPPRYVSVDRSAGPGWVIQWQDEGDMEGDASDWIRFGQQAGPLSGYTLPQWVWPVYPPWSAGGDISQVNDSDHQPPVDGLSAHRSDPASDPSGDITDVTPTGDVTNVPVSVAVNSSRLKEAVRDTLASIFEDVLQGPDAAETSIEATNAAEITEATIVPSESVTENQFETGAGQLLEDRLATASTSADTLDGRQPIGSCTDCDDDLKWTPLLLPGSAGSSSDSGSGFSAGHSGSVSQINTPRDPGTTDSQWLVFEEAADIPPITNDFDLALDSSRDSLGPPGGYDLGNYEPAFSTDYDSDRSADDYSDYQYLYQDQIPTVTEKVGITDRVSRIWGGLRRRIRRLFPTWRYLTTWRTPWWYNDYRKNLKRHRGHRHRKRPRPSYGAPRPRPKPSYGPPKFKRRPKPSYGPPKSKPKPSYGPPKAKPRPKPSYGPPKALPKPSYGPPKAKPKPSYEASKLKPKPKPKPSYGPPKAKPRPSYGPPKVRPKPSYGPPKATPKPSYGPPKAKLKPSYGVPKAKTRPSHGAPRAKPGHSYDASEPKPSSSYGAPSKRPSQKFGPPYYTQPSTSSSSSDQHGGLQLADSPRGQQLSSTLSLETPNFGGLHAAALDAHVLDPVVEVDYGDEPAFRPNRLHQEHGIYRPPPSQRPNRPYQQYRPNGQHRPHQHTGSPNAHRFPSFDRISARFRAEYDRLMGRLNGLLRRLPTLPRVPLPALPFPLVPSPLRKNTGDARRRLVLQYTDGDVPAYAAPALLQDRSGLHSDSGRSPAVDGFLSALVILPFMMFALQRAAVFGELIGNSTGKLWVVDALTREGDQLVEATSRLLQDLNTLTVRCPDAEQSYAEAGQKDAVQNDISDHYEVALIPDEQHNQ